MSSPLFAAHLNAWKTATVLKVVDQSLESSKATREKAEAERAQREAEQARAEADAQERRKERERVEADDARQMALEYSGQRASRLRVFAASDLRDSYTPA